MKQNESSITSLISTFGRAYHSQHDTPLIFDDYMAKLLISPQEFSDISNNMVKGIHFFNPDLAHEFKDDPEKALKWITQVQLSPITLARAAYCEQVLLHEVALGLKQVVILGAGMDTFALRHSELEDTLEIIEVDYPATQQFKKERLNQAKLTIPDNLHFVPMDFTRGLSNASLALGGLKERKTMASLLGVSYYLPKNDLFNVIRHVFANLPTGSSIVLDYADEHLFEEKGMFNRVENMIKLAAMGGEPMQSGYAYVEMETLLDEAGLLIYEHLTPEAIQEQFFQDRIDHLRAFETIHFIHAVKK